MVPVKFLFDIFSGDLASAEEIPLLATLTRLTRIVPLENSTLDVMGLRLLPITFVLLRSETFSVFGFLFLSGELCSPRLSR